MKIILASKSPRRHELLSMLGYEIQTLVSELDEDSISAETPWELCKALSSEKAKAVYNILQDDSVPIIAADTLVEVNGKILGKPKDRDDAKNMLLSLSGTRHYVHTGFTIIYKGQMISEFDTSVVIFRDITDKELEDYLDSKEPFDKAGAYGIQGKAGAFVERIEGDFFSIMGLPICKISKILRDFS